MSGGAGAATERVEVPLLGVIDLRCGRAVHAVAGRRDAYRPLRTAACPDADPLRLAEHYRGLHAAGLSAAGLSTAGLCGAGLCGAGLSIAGLYVADLDRIVDHSDASQAAVDSLLALEMPLWIDRGLETAADYAALAGANRPAAATSIVASESLRSLEELRTLVARRRAPAATAAPPLAVSLDLRDGRVVAAAEELADREPLEVAERIAAAGVERLIVLDVTRVGTGAGPSTAPLCRRIKHALPELTLCSGGGVRNAADAAALREAGCEFVLVGTWLLQSDKCLTSSPKPR